MLWSYFSSPLLPSQVEAVSTSSCEKLPQLLDGTRKSTGQEADSPFSLPGLKKQQVPTFFLKYINVDVLPLCQKALPLNKYTSLSTKQGVINTSSEALFKDNHCFFEWSTTQTLSFLSFSLLLFSRFHLCILWCPLSALFQVKLCGIQVKTVLFPSREKNSPLDTITLLVRYHQFVIFCKLWGIVDFSVCKMP